VSFDRLLLPQLPKTDLLNVFDSVFIISGMNIIFIVMSRIWLVLRRDEELLKPNVTRPTMS